MAGVRVPSFAQVKSFKLPSYISPTQVCLYNFLCVHKIDICAGFFFTVFVTKNCRFTTFRYHQSYHTVFGTPKIASSLTVAQSSQLLPIHSIFQFHSIGLAEKFTTESDGTVIPVLQLQWYQFQGR